MVIRLAVAAVMLLSAKAERRGTAQQTPDAHVARADTATPTSSGCTTLQNKTTYKQENAPTDITALFANIYDRINEDLDDVMSVQITYVGDVIHRIVGTHNVRATVTRRPETGEETTECMVVPVHIEDTDECALPEGHPMRHECHSSAVCENSIGSYDCACPDGAACIPASGIGLCVDVSTSAHCCNVDMQKRPNGCRDTMCASDCRRDFRCWTNMCDGKCVYPELCESKQGSVTCGCKEGEVGNGHKCSGATPKIFTDAHGNLLPAGLDTSLVCGCQKPEPDYCHGVTCGLHAICRVMDGAAECECQSGFRHVEGVGCMDDSAPTLVLKGPEQMTMKQCDKYVEMGVEVLDANSESTDRNVGVSYSQPPGRCSPEIGTFTVNYTLNTEWTHPAVQSIVRYVTVEDIDECSIQPGSPADQCPDCRPRCHEHAKCENLIGSYTCTCPACMIGDGFTPFVPKKSSRKPAGYAGGSGCRDVCPPVITPLGDNPLVLEVGANTDVSGSRVRDRNFTEELSRLIQATNGSALCDEGPRSRCAKVIDNNGTHENVDITHKLVILSPVKVSEDPPQWHVTYNAQDEAGNYAIPVVRTIEIKEITKEEYAARRVEEAVAEALRTRCPGCKGCPACPDPPAPRPCAGSRKGQTSCRDCPCGERDDCMARSDCQARALASPTGTPGTCTSGNNGAGRWCLPVVLSGAGQMAVALCFVGVTIIALVAVSR